MTPYCANCGFELPEISTVHLGGIGRCPNCGNVRYNVSGPSLIEGVIITISANPPYPIRHKSDYQRDWKGLLPFLILGDYSYEKRSLTGDAPKDFITLSSRAIEMFGHNSISPSYIAKVGIKSYPNESITEHLNCRIAQTIGIRTAPSVLGIMNEQVRLFSNYFLNSTEELIHGVEIIEKLLGEEYVREISEKHLERSHYTFQIIETAIDKFFQDTASVILMDFIRMLAYDALIGLHDRHHANWGVIRSVTGQEVPRFAPLYDNARALFWNESEAYVEQILRDPNMLEAYIRRSLPVMGWESAQGKLNHFDLIRTVAAKRTLYRDAIITVLEGFAQESVESLLENEFSELMSHHRRQAIALCLKKRHDFLKTCV